jgi:DNA-directed RNA polymerase sigma subunit (sigma70/sigma32)
MLEKITLAKALGVELEEMIEERHKKLREQYKKALATLDPLHEAIMRMRIGEDGEIHSYKEVTAKHGLSKKRIRQIEVMVMRRMRGF